MNYHLLNTVKPMQSIWQSYEGLVPYFPAACIGFGGIVPALFEASSVEDLPLVANYCYCVQTNFQGPVKFFLMDLECMAGLLTYLGQENYQYFPYCSDIVPPALTGAE